MRLLKLDEDGEPVLAKDYRHDSLPPYGILSHTWEADDQEVTFEDISNGLGKTKAGFKKICFCGQQAKKDGFTYFWVDSCCIDKRNNAELSEAINSMFKWYKNAGRCYVYLNDVSSLKRDSNDQARNVWEGAFRSSRWHQRGWTLQELVAPKEVSFFTRDGNCIGDKVSLERLIHEITRIPIGALRGAPLAHFPIEERLRWAAHRETTKLEDKTYSLFGIFNVFLPPIYGEGDHALVRLKEAIEKHGNNFDHTLLTSIRPPTAIHEAAEPSTAAVQEHRRSQMAALEFEQMDARRTTIKDAQSKTCEWVLTHPSYAAWNNTSVTEQSRQIMWISGKPGVGKSTIMKYVLNHAQTAQAEGEIILSFFFNARGDELEKITLGMYRTLLHQLLSAVPDLQRVLDASNTSAPVEQQYSWSLEQLQRAFTAAVAQLGQLRLRCFIDALDECDERQIRDMVEFFEDLIESSSDLRCQLLICFASRHYPTIHIEHGHRLTLEDEAGHDADMTKYIRRHLRAGSGNVLKEIHEQIQEKANGVFLWAVLVVGSLKIELERGRMFALKRRLQDLKKRLDEIPKGLSELFRDILHRDHVNKNDLILCLQWILFAKKPLERKEFYFAMISGLHQDLDSTEWQPEPWDQENDTLEIMDLFVVNASKGLAEVTKAKPYTVQFIHESVRDFLLRDGGLADIYPYQDHNFESTAHEKLKICCQNYLAVSLSDIAHTDEPLSEASSDRAKDLRQSLPEQFPFLRYASQYVLSHADAAAKEISQSSFLVDFQFSKWLDITNLLERAKIRRHSQGTKLLYILAEMGHARLISCIAQQEHQGDIPESSLFDPEQRYGHALLAAFVNGHLDAMRAICYKCASFITEEIRRDPDFGKATGATSLRKGEHVYHWALRTRNIALAFVERFQTPGQGFLSSSLRLCAIAIKEKRSPILKRLLASGVDANASESIERRCDSFNPDLYLPLLIHAISAKDITSLGLLLDYGASLEIRTLVDQWTPLMYAAMVGYKEMVDWLLSRSADVHAVERRGSTALVLAAKRGYSDIVQLLLAKGAKVDAANNNNQTSLMFAAAKGHINIVQQLLAGGAEVNAVDFISNSALLQAVEHGHSNIVQILLAQGAKVNVANDDGRTSLMLAAAKGYIDIMQWLLAEGAEVNAVNCIGNSALLQAVERGRSNIGQILLAQGAKVNVVNNDGRTSLMLAAAKGYVNTVRWLLAAGAEVNAVDYIGNSALLQAVRHGRKDIVQILLAEGAEVNIATEDGRKSLTLAAGEGYINIVQQLIAKGAEVNAVDYIGNSALLQAVEHGFSNIVEVLLAKGALVNVPNHDGRTSLVLAAGKGHGDIILLLLAYGANINDVDEYGRTSLMLAVARRYSDVVQILLAKGAETETAQWDDGWTCLTLAAAYGHSNIVRMLLSHGANVEARTTRGNCTPLMLAAWNGRNNTVRDLLKAGAKVNITDNDHWTPLFYAVYRDREDIVELLLENGADIGVADCTGCTASFYATYRDDYFSVREVIERHILNKGIVNSHIERSAIAADTCSISPLHSAARLDEPSTVQRLLEGGADVNEVDEHGYTALHYAVAFSSTPGSYEQFEIVKLLLSAGASANTRRWALLSGKTALGMLAGLPLVPIDVKRLLAKADAELPGLDRTRLMEKMRD